uniref:PPM-type phosphatase domain-containing protein n=1 Tax=Arcella intermedia TaxID=1963864 RepID=A0A6B2KXN2_9EUKA
MNMKIDVTLGGREREKVPPTATLKLKLKNCISQISVLLNELEDSLEAQDDDSLTWEEERKKLTEKRLELERRLNMNKSSDVKEKPKVTLQTETTIETRKAKTVAVSQDVDLKSLANELQTELDEEQEAFYANLALKGNMEKRLKKSAQKFGKISGSKRREREIGHAISPWAETQADGGPRAKKQKSISKATSEEYTLVGAWQAEPQPDFDIGDAGSLLSKLHSITNAKSDDESSTEESGESSSTKDVLNDLNNLKITPAVVSNLPSKPISKNELLDSLLSPCKKESSEEDGTTDSEASSPEVNKKPTLADFNKENGNAQDIIFALEKFKKPSQESVPLNSSKRRTNVPKLERTRPALIKTTQMTLPLPVSTIEKSTTTISSAITKKKKSPTGDPPPSLDVFSGTKSLAKPPSISARSDQSKSSDRHTKRSHEKRVEPKKHHERPKVAPAKPIDKYATVSEKRTSTYDNFGSVSEKRKSFAKQKDNKEPQTPHKTERTPEKPKPAAKSIDTSVATDLLPGGSTFDVLRKLNQYNKERKEESSESEILQSPESSIHNAEFDPLTCELIQSYTVKEDVNKGGLRRGNKVKLNYSKGGKADPMEDTHFCAFPFLSSKDYGLFCVFDGHAGKDCASELITLFPKIFKKHWKKSKDKAQTDFTNLWIEVYKEVDGLLAQFEDLGSTATTLLIWRTPDGKRYIQCANVGDSTAFLVRENKVIPMSQDHKLSVKSERHRITNSGIHLEEKQTRLNGIAITRAFGDHFAKNHNCGLISEPFVSPAMEITPKDTRVILASDGLWDVVKGQRACDITKGIKESGDAAKKLLQTAVKSNHCTDNVTVIVVNLR